MRILQKYLAAFDITEKLESPLFVGVLKNGKPNGGGISGMQVARIIKAVFGKEFSGHSGRTGFVTECVKQGIGFEQIANQTRQG